jgi:D-proline reductase (dithiol) PrdB
VGLIQRKIEARGIPTVSISVAKDVTADIKVPRAVFVPWPMGHHFGVPFHTGIQRKVILSALDAVQRIEQSGTIIELAIPWAEVRRQSKALSEQGKKL